MLRMFQPNYFCMRVIRYMHNNTTNVILNPEIVLENKCMKLKVLHKNYQRNNHMKWRVEHSFTLKMYWTTTLIKMFRLLLTTPRWGHIRDHIFNRPISDDLSKYWGIKTEKTPRAVCRLVNTCISNYFAQ